MNPKPIQRFLLGVVFYEKLLYQAFLTPNFRCLNCDETLFRGVHESSQMTFSKSAEFSPTSRIRRDSLSLPLLKTYARKKTSVKAALTHTFKLIKKSRCSLTVSLSNSTLCWGHKPKLSRIASMSEMILKPLTSAEPSVGGNSPVNIDMVVVFPAPLCPRRAVI